MVEMFWIYIVKRLPESSDSAGNDHSSGAAAMVPPYRTSGYLRWIGSRKGRQSAGSISTTKCFEHSELLYWVSYRTYNTNEASHTPYDADA
jgi:hypothetical protein